MRLFCKIFAAVQNSDPWICRKGPGSCRRVNVNNGRWMTLCGGSWAERGRRFAAAAHLFPFIKTNATAGNHGSPQP